MTDIRITRNPFTKKVTIQIENKEISSLENKIYAFVNSTSFTDCLLPFNKRYVIWLGLLPELINEVNDDRLYITFEGIEENFRALEDAFNRSKDFVDNLGYENNWVLTYVRNFDDDSITESLIDTATKIKDVCLTRAEMYEIDDLIEKSEFNGKAATYKKLMNIISKHLENYENSMDRFKQEKIDFLQMIANNLQQIEIEING